MKLFRKTRRRLIRLGKIRSYFVYAFGEIVLIVIGILIAWKINDLNEVRKNRITEVKIYNSLHEELNANLHTLDDAIASYPKTIKRLQNTLNYVGFHESEISDGAKDTIINLLERDVNLIDGSVNSVISTTKFELIESRELKDLINLYPNKIEDFNIQDKKIRDIISLKIKPILEDKLSLIDMLPPNDTIYRTIRAKGYKSNYEALLKSKEYQNAIIDRILQTQILLSKAKNLRSKTNTLISSLDEELN